MGKVIRKAGMLVMALTLVSLAVPGALITAPAEEMYTQAAPGAAAASETATEETAAETAGASYYGPGSYIIGEDMPPGEYAVFTEDGSPEGIYSACTLSLYKDDTDQKRIGTFQFQHHGLITLYKGQHLVLARGYAVLADQAGITPGTTGMYKAGRDMEPGTYRLTPLTSGGAYYALYNDVRYYYDYIDEYGMLFGPAVITVEEGQYLELYDVGSVERL